MNGRDSGQDTLATAQSTPSDTAPEVSVTESSQESSAPEETALSPADELLARAERLALGYDYDGAISLLTGDSQLSGDPRIQEAAAGYEAAKAALVRTPITQITHVFFHSLVVDNKKAFDGDDDEGGYNQVMTTVSEFEKIIQTLYDKGYVLVRLHDMAYETTDENGNTVMKAGDIMLPPGKTPFVMSQDDLCYYAYMTGDGFASRMVVGEDGKPTCEMVLDDGSTVTGAYDLVPILENFIQEHPDFSYKGARAVLAFTGYQGILGYRTAANYADSPTYEQDRQEAARVAQCLKDNGWELASHSWGHLNLGTVEWDRFKTDTDKWESEVDSLIGPTDIILYPFGADIGDWHPYTTENPRFDYLYAAGFRYFCNVDSNQYWVQLGDTFLRQGRRNLDGYRMWKDITAEDPSHRKLDDLFRAEDVFDPDRPTPVPEM
ncbi:MAG: polysaccharide deacetylase [Eubacteriales bacterium]|nr:polysaccharide deacetylase [Eubacteriales bacterium]